MDSSSEMLELLEKVRRIHISSRKAVDEFMAGQYRSVFRGGGIEFHEVRDYQPGDDVTARTGKLHIKSFAEERERTVLLLVDASSSMDFGSGEHSKAHTAAELCALLIFSAVSNSDRVGLTLFSDHAEFTLPPAKGVQHGLRLIRELLCHRTPGRGTSIEAVLEELMRVYPKRAVVFLVSDFLDRPGYDRKLRIAASKHDLVAIRVRDPREGIMGGKGIIRFRDLETGCPAELNLGSRRAREKYAAAAHDLDQELKRFFSMAGIDLLDVEAGKPCEEALRAFFDERMRRNAP